MQTFKPITHVRIQAIQFKEWTANFWDAYPMRYIIEDDERNMGHHELWVERDKTWRVIAPKDWIVLDEDGVGFYTISQVDFQTQYEPA